MAQNLKWGYVHSTCQPDQWAKYYPTSGYQSPVNILVDEALCQSTCCVGRQSPLSAPASPDGVEMIMLAQAAAIKCNIPSSAKSRGQAAGPACLAGKRRSHLDSVGDDHQRSSSASSTASSSPAAAQLEASDYDDDDDDDDDDDGNNYTIGNDNSENYDDNGNGNDTNNNGASAKTRRSLGTMQQGQFEEQSKQQQQQYQQQRLQLRPAKGHATGAVDRNRNNKKAFGPCQNTRHCVSNKKLFLGYPRYLSTMQLCNTGHNWQVNLPPELATHTLLAGPPFGNREYRLAQFHCHWGKHCDQGSEHQINGKAFAAEIHFVHWNCTDFDSIEEASKHKHGLAVLAVLVQALNGDQNRNKHLEKIIAGLKCVAHKPNSSVNVHARLDLKKLFPANRWAYANYEGSLTTPPLSEVVDWVVFLNPIQCSSAQIEQFRQIKSSSPDDAYLIDNCRPVQPINERVVSIWSHHNNQNHH